MFVIVPDPLRRVTDMDLAVNTAAAEALRARHLANIDAVARLSSARTAPAASDMSREARVEQALADAQIDT